MVLHRPVEAEWERWRDLRLRMLADTPHAFAETLAAARAHGEDEWRWRVRRSWQPGSLTVVAVAPDGRWVGTMGTFTDLRQGVFLVSVFVDPAHRGGDVADRLMGEVVRWARSRPGADGMLLHVHEDNPRAGVLPPLGLHRHRGAGPVQPRPGAARAGDEAGVHRARAGPGGRRGRRLAPGGAGLLTRRRGSASRRAGGARPQVATF